MKSNAPKLTISLKFQPLPLMNRRTRSFTRNWNVVSLSPPTWSNNCRLPISIYAIPGFPFPTQCNPDRNSFYFQGILTDREARHTRWAEPILQPAWKDLWSEGYPKCTVVAYLSITKVMSVYFFSSKSIVSEGKVTYLSYKVRSRRQGPGIIFIPLKACA